MLNCIMFHMLSQGQYLSLKFVSAVICRVIQKNQKTKFKKTLTRNGERRYILIGCPDGQVNNKV